MALAPTASRSSGRSTPRTARTSEHGQSAFFTTRREPRLVTAEQRRRGVRSSYIGSEVFLGLVDSAHAPFSGDLRQLSIQTMCTNRDLVLQMPVGIGKSDFTLDVAAPVTTIRVVSGPSRPFAPLADGAIAWRAISHLSLNYLSLVNATQREGAAALRDLLELYAASERHQCQEADRRHPFGAGASGRPPAAVVAAGVGRRTFAGTASGVRTRPRDHCGS